MAKSFRFPRWVEKTRTYSIHPVAFIDQPVATPHQPRYAQQLPPGGSQGGIAAPGRQVGDPYQAQKLLACSSQQDTTYSLFTLTYYFRSRRWAMPGGSGNQRIGTGSVRHCLAALPPGSEAFSFLCVRHRGGSGTNGSIQAPCVIVWWHCRPFMYFLPGGVASTCFFHIHRV